MSKTFLFWFGVCFVCYFLRTAFTILNYRGKKIGRSKFAIRGVYVAMFLLWLSWFQMCLFDATVMSVPAWLKYFGLLLFLSGILFFVLSQLQIKGFEESSRLITKGIYARIRNPMYLGFIFWIIGFPLFLEKAFSFVSSVIWITQIFIWKAIEEKELEKKHPEYLDYKKSTWF